MPLNVPSSEALHVPYLIAIALPIPPSVSPVDSRKSEGITPRPTRPLFTYVAPFSVTDTSEDDADFAGVVPALEDGVGEHLASVSSDREHKDNEARAWIEVDRIMVKDTVVPPPARCTASQYIGPLNRQRVSLSSVQKRERI